LEKGADVKHPWQKRRRTAGLEIAQGRVVNGRPKQSGPDLVGHALIFALIVILAVIVISLLAP